MGGRVDGLAVAVHVAVVVVEVVFVGRGGSELESEGGHSDAERQ